ncbi:MAG: FliM/FliN family flagellar motor switch protein [Gemmatimonadota bacterium]
MSADARPMASGTLSQSEIDRLLGGASNVPFAGASEESPVQMYDFRRPHRVSKERLRTLEAIYERLVKSLESWVIGRVRGQIEMRLQGVEQFSFGEFTLSLPTPCASFICEINDSGGQLGVVDIGEEFAFYMVDRLFGGSGQQMSTSRPLTRVERMALRGLVEKVNSLLAEVWSDYITMSLEISSFESFPDILLQSANRDDPVLVANIEVTAGDVSSLMLVCLPFAVLDKFFTNTATRSFANATGSEHERAVSRALAEHSLRATRVNVSARLPEFRMSMRDLASLSQGGVITTALPSDSPIRVMVGDQERFAGTAGRVGHKLAIRLEGALTQSGEVRGAAPVVPQFDASVIAEALHTQPISAE